jgi:hypothetical protein
MEFQMIPVDSYPDKPSLRGRSKYLPILMQFVALNKPLVRIDFDWPLGTTNGNVQTVVTSLRSTASRNGIPIKVISREGDIYLMLDPAPVARVKDMNIEEVA